MELILFFIRGPLGIFSPILLILLCLWLGRDSRSPRLVKASLLALLLLLVLILFRFI